MQLFIGIQKRWHGKGQLFKYFYLLNQLAHKLQLNLVKQLFNLGGLENKTYTIYLLWNDIFTNLSIFNRHFPSPKCPLHTISSISATYHETSHLRKQKESKSSDFILWINPELTSIYMINCICGKKYLISVFLLFILNSVSHLWTKVFSIQNHRKLQWIFISQ